MATKQYLDKTGLQHLIEKINGKYVDKVAQAAIDAAQDARIEALEGVNLSTLTLNGKAYDPKGSAVTIDYGVAYDSSAKKIYLTQDGANLGDGIDATAFIKDGMLDSANLVVNPEGQTAGTYIKLVFNTESAKESIFINVTSLIDIYTLTAGTGGGTNVKVTPVVGGTGNNWTVGVTVDESVLNQTLATIQGNITTLQGNITTIQGTSATLKEKADKEYVDSTFVKDADLVALSNDDIDAAWNAAIA